MIADWKIRVQRNFRNYSRQAAGKATGISERLIYYKQVILSSLDGKMTIPMPPPIPKKSILKIYLQAISM
jgi:hypothetical protein